MKVTVRMFARARELAGTDVLEVEVSGEGTLGDLRACLARIRPTLAVLLSRSALALGEEFATDDRRLQEGDVVALLPPVSGG